MKGFTTKAIHGSIRKKDPHGTLRPAIYESVAFEFQSALDMQQTFEGTRPAHAYSRSSNPTVEEFEDRVRILADAKGVIAVSSGMAAISNVILALAESGANIVSSKFLFGNTHALFHQTFRPWGLQVAYVDMANPTELEAAINGKTRALFLESIANPQMQVVDLRMVTAIADKHNLPVILDGTVTTPYLLKSRDYGVAVEVISSTKCISGGATSVGGLIIDNGLFDWKKSAKVRPWTERPGATGLLTYLRRDVYRNTGGCLSPHSAYLHTLGLETLELRFQKSCANALQIARALRQFPKVKSVLYPGLETSPSYKIARSQFQNGYGSLVSFCLESKEACFALMDACKLVRRATNLQDNKTLIIHPASTIYCDYSAEEKADMQVGENLLRLSVGIEDVDDILEDLTAACLR